MKVAVIDDHELFSASLELLLELNENITDYYAYTSCEAFIADNISPPFNLIFLDFHLQHKETTGFSAIKKIQLVSPGSRIVVLSGEVKPEIVKQVIDVGVSGYIPKHINPDELKKAISCVTNGGVYLPHKIIDLEHVRNDFDFNSVQEKIDSLTKRERQILNLVAQGKVNKEISKELYIEVSTVKVHLSKIYSKLAVTNRTEAVYLLANYNQVCL